MNHEGSWKEACFFISTIIETILQIVLTNDLELHSFVQSIIFVIWINATVDRVVSVYFWNLKEEREGKREWRKSIGLVLYVYPWKEKYISLVYLKSIKNEKSWRVAVYRQKQPSRDVLGKRSSENFHQIFRRTPMPKCDFNKVVARQLYGNRISAWVFSCNRSLIAEIWNLFQKKNSIDN